MIMFEKVGLNITITQIQHKKRIHTQVHVSVTSRALRNYRYFNFVHILENRKSWMHCMKAFGIEQNEQTNNHLIIKIYICIN